MPKPLKVIKICKCPDCPWVCKAAGGKKPYCNNPKLAASRPYSENKQVTLEGPPPEWCPL